jgi:uncharacterized protein (DUF2147 family)
VDYCIDTDRLMHGKRFTGILIVLLAALLARAAGPAQSIQGLWKTMDDKTHQPRGVVRIYQDNGQFFGKIVRSFDPKEAKEVCAPCSGPLHNKPIIGMLILRDMRQNGNKFSGGTIVDPDTGESYRCKMTLEDGGQKLTVRGYIGLAVFGRTQVWTRYAPPKGMRDTGGE